MAGIAGGCNESHLANRSLAILLPAPEPEGSGDFAKVGQVVSRQSPESSGSNTTSPTGACANFRLRQITLPRCHSVGIFLFNALRFYKYSLVLQKFRMFLKFLRSF